MLENCIALGVGGCCLFVCCNKLISLQKSMQEKKGLRLCVDLGFGFIFLVFLCFVLSLFWGFVFLMLCFLFFLRCTTFCHHLIMDLVQFSSQY